MKISILHTMKTRNSNAGCIYTLRSDYWGVSFFSFFSSSSPSFFLSSTVKQWYAYLKHFETNRTSSWSLFFFLLFLLYGYKQKGVEGASGKQEEKEEKCLWEIRKEESEKTSDRERKKSQIEWRSLLSMLLHLFLVLDLHFVVFMYKWAEKEFEASPFLVPVYVHPRPSTAMMVMREACMSAFFLFIDRKKRREEEDLFVSSGYSSCLWDSINRLERGR